MIAETWRSLPPVARALVGIVVFVVAFDLLLAGVTVATGGSGPGGPMSSSYATGDDGLAAFADLVARNGHQVQRLRVRLDRARLDPSTTVVLADPERVTGDETHALAAFVAAGGRLVGTGQSAAPALAAVVGGGLEWDDAAVASAHPLVPVPELTAVATVETAGDGSWSEAGATLPMLGGNSRVVATVASVGAGRVVALADTSPLQNRLLARSDNAALGLGLVGDESRPVAFAEAQHGYGEGTGLRAVPARWRWALAGAFVAVLVWMWSRARRLGPPDDVELVQPPPRRAYVDAMAAALARTRQPDVVVVPLQERARRRLAARAGLPPDAPDDDLHRAAHELVAAEDVDALFRPCRTDADVLAVGRVMAHLSAGA